MTFAGGAAARVALLITALAGCYQAPQSDCTIPCGAEGRCPSSFSCDHGYCTRGPVCAGDAGDANGAADAASDSPVGADSTPPPVDAGDVSGVGTWPSGHPCGSPLDCHSGLCVDTVCCASTCDPCSACNIPGKEGACAAVPSGVKSPACLDQGAACGFDGTCDGLGKCFRPPGGQLCAPGRCEGGILVPPSRCDGQGTCVGPVTVDCAPFACIISGGVPICRADCQTDVDCMPVVDCINNSCGPRRIHDNGAGCVTNMDCVSNFCTDGVCCSSRCDGPCTSCNQAGDLGNCRLVPNLAADPRGLCKNTGAAACGTNGLCDGAGHCLKHPSGTICDAAQ